MDTKCYLGDTCPGDFCTHFELFIDAQLPDLLQFQAQMTLQVTMIDMTANKRLTWAPLTNKSSGNCNMEPLIDNDDIQIQSGVAGPP